MEIRGVTEANKAVKRRIETSFLCSTSYLRIADSLRNQIMATIDEANKRSIQWFPKNRCDFESDHEGKAFSFCGRMYQKHKTIEFRTYDNGDQVPVITRERPGAYLIFPCSDKVKNVLTMSGVTLKEVANEQEMDVQGYKKNSKGSFSLEKIKIEVPKGAVLIDAFQPMGNTLSDLIEPEGGNSIYTNGQIKISSKTETCFLFTVFLMNNYRNFKPKRNL